MSAEHWCEWLLDDVIQNSITIDEWRTHKVNLIFHNKYALYSRLILSQEKYRNFALLHDTKEVTYLDSHRVPPNLCGTLVGMFITASYEIFHECHWQSSLWFVCCYSITFQSPVRCLAWCLFSAWTSDYPDMSCQSQRPNSHNFLVGYVVTSRQSDESPHTTEMKLVANTNFHVSHTCKAVDGHGAR